MCSVRMTSAVHQNHCQSAITMMTTSPDCPSSCASWSFPAAIPMSHHTFPNPPQAPIVTCLPIFRRHRLATLRSPLPSRPPRLSLLAGQILRLFGSDRSPITYRLRKKTTFQRCRARLLENRRFHASVFACCKRKCEASIA